MRILIIFSSIILNTLAGMAQISSIYPDQVSSFFYNYALNNAAYIPQEGKSELVFQNKMRTSIYDDISTYTGSLQKTFTSKDAKLHSARIILLNEKEGQYIATPRFYGNYALQLQLKDHLSLSGGIALGFVNPNINTPTKSVDVNLLDGALGIILNYKKTSFGFTCNQFLNSSNRTVSDIVLKRYYNFHLQNTFSVSPYLELKSCAMFRYFTDIPVQLQLNGSAVYDEYLELGTGYKLKRGAMFFASVYLEEISGIPVKIGGLYNSNFLNNATALGNSFELNLVYFY